MDQKLLFLINREWTGPMADRLMALVSSWAAWLPITLVLIVLLLWKGDFRARAFVLTAALIVGINDGVVAQPLKRLADRPRPHQVFLPFAVRIVDLAKARPRILAVFKPAKVKTSRPQPGDVDGRSFPSSHTMNFFSFALVGFCFYRLRVVWLFGIAALVGYSRIYTGSHWPSDVLTSMVLACGTTLLLLAGIGLLWRRYGGVWLPRVHAQHPSLYAA